MVLTPSVTSTSDQGPAQCPHPRPEVPWLRLVWEAQGDKFTLWALGFLEPAEPQLREGGREGRRGQNQTGQGTCRGQDRAQQTALSPGPSLRVRPASTGERGGTRGR